MTNEAVILTHELTKSYGNAEAVRGLNLSVGRNSITAFLGRNGAGKNLGLVSWAAEQMLAVGPV